MNSPSTQKALPRPTGGVSRYAQLATELRSRITAGEWAPGSALPAEAQLAQQHHVALGTMRQALALLVADNLLERRHGHGTFVTAGLAGASMLRFFRFRAAAGDTNAQPTARILRRRVVRADAQTCQALGLVDANAQVLELLRLRSLAQQPCLLETLWLPLPLFEPLRDGDPSAWGDLLYPVYQQLCGVTVHRAQDALRFATLNTDQARQLHLPAQHPCVQVERHAFDLAGRCIERRLSYGNAHDFHYTLNLH